MTTSAAPRLETGNRRDQLLAVAREVFAEEGYHKASMREIARRSGMTQAAIYYHFANKEEVLFTLIEDFTDRFVGALMAAVAAPATPAEKLERLIATQLDMLLSSSRDLKILVQDKTHLSPLRLRLIRSKEKVVLMVYRATLEEMRKLGQLTDVDPTAAAFSIIGAINSLYHWYRPGGKLSFDAVRRSIVTMALSGVRRKEEE